MLVKFDPRLSFFTRFSAVILTMLDEPYMHYKALNMLYNTMQCKGQHNLIFSEIAKIKHIEFIP